MISLQVGYCWLWSLIFQIQRFYSVIFVPQFYYTFVTKLWDVCWTTVLWSHGIGLTVVFFHGISPIKEKHHNMNVVVH